MKKKTHFSIFLKALVLSTALVLGTTVSGTPPAVNEVASGAKQYLRQKNRPAILFVKSDSGQVRLHEGRIVKKNEKSGFTVPVYYRNGIKSESQKYIPTGEILVSLGKNNRLSYEEFSSENGLIFLKEVNRLYRTGLFRPLDSGDIIELVNRLNQLPNIRRAAPNWISPRKIR